MNQIINSIVKFVKTHPIYILVGIAAITLILIWWLK
jgi:hypothetical protein